MSTAWSSDFSYNYFKKILQAVKSNFELYLFSGAPKIINAIDRPKIILRHDVDIDLAKALKMAEIEEKFGVRATYMVMVNSPLYDIKDKLSQSILFRLISNFFIEFIILSIVNGLSIIFVLNQPEIGVISMITGSLLAIIGQIYKEYDKEIKLSSMKFSMYHS